MRSRWFRIFCFLYNLLPGCSATMIFDCVAHFDCSNTDDQIQFTQFKETILIALYLLYVRYRMNL